MFSRHEVTVGGWIAFWIVSSIPFVNFIFWLVLLFSGSTNKTLKNFLVAWIVVFIVYLVLFFGLGFGAVLLDSLAY
jgi:hypothetical protein